MRFSRLTSLAAAVSLSAAQIVGAAPEPMVTLNYSFYSVYGSTTAEITDSIHTFSPVVINGGRFAAVTNNVFESNYSAVGTSTGGCEVKNTFVRLKTTVVLPQLVQHSQSQQVILEWNRYIKALHEHELLHASNGRRTAETVAARLHNFKTALPCSQMRDRLDRAVDQLIDNMAQWDRDLDAKTGHGHTQGTQLHPHIK